MPSFEELAGKYKSKNEDRPVVLKFLIDTPAGGMRGFNMLMPERPGEVQEATEQDVAMEEVDNEEERKDEMEVVSVEPVSSPDTATDDVSMENEEQTKSETAQPDPPLAPIIETVGPDIDSETKTGEPSEGTVEGIGEAQEATDLAAGFSGGRTSEPVILTPAKPRPPTPPKIMRANPKPKPKEGAVPKDFTPGSQPVIPKMTTEVRQVPKRAETTAEPRGSETVVGPKAMPKQPPNPPPSPRQREMAAATAAKDSTAASTTGTATADNPIPEGTNNQQNNQPWVIYTGTGHDVRDPRRSDTSNQYNLPPRGRGRGRSGGTWQPVTKGGSKGGAQTLSEAWDTDYSGNWSSNPTASSSSSRGRGKGRGGKGRGRTQHQYEDWIATGLRGSVEEVRPLLRWYYQDQYNYDLDEFWYCPSDGSWYVNGRNWR